MLMAATPSVFLDHLSTESLSRCYNESARLAESDSSFDMFTTGETQYKDNCLTHKLSKNLLSLPRTTMYTAQRLSV